MAAPKKKTSTTKRAATTRKTQPVARRKEPGITTDVNLAVRADLLTLGAVRPSKGSRPKRVRIGRGHGSGLVKTGGEGGKGQSVRSGGGKGPSFEGGQTPWARRLPHKRGYSQKARDIGHFRARFAVVNLHQLSKWDASIEVS